MNNKSRRYLKDNKSWWPHFLLYGMALLSVPLLICTEVFGQSKSPEKVDLYAVVVGVKKFTDSTIPPLARSDTDARDIAKFIQEKKNLFRAVHMTVLVNEQATRANVAAALRQNLKPAGKDDIVLVYLSGHGMAESSLGNEFYYLTYDAKLDNLFGTALLMNDANLFKGVDSKNVLLLSDACHSGGFNTLLDGATAKSADKFLAMFQGLPGRVAISSSRPDEKSYEKDIYGNSIFTHFLLKGLRGEAESGSDGSITAKGLYNYVYKKSREATNGLQNPQLYCAKGVDENAKIFMRPKYAEPLQIKAQFFYEADDKTIKPLDDSSVLRSGQHVGCAFKAESDCFVYIYWWDSTGNMGRLFPNPELTEGSGEVKRGRTYWLPSQEGERWYILDNNPGTETIYFVASRQRNENLENLFERTISEAGETRSERRDEARSERRDGAKPEQDGAGSDRDRSRPKPETESDGDGLWGSDRQSPPRGKESQRNANGEMQRELSLMGFAPRTTPKNVQKTSFESRENIFKEYENRINVSGAEAVFKVEFRHVR